MGVVLIETSVGVELKTEPELDFLFLLKIFGICLNFNRGIDPKPLSDNDLPSVGVKHCDDLIGWEFEVEVIPEVEPEVRSCDENWLRQFPIGAQAKTGFGFNTDDVIFWWFIIDDSFWNSCLMTTFVCKLEVDKLLFWTTFGFGLLATVPTVFVIFVPKALPILRIQFIECSFLDKMKFYSPIHITHDQFRSFTMFLGLLEVVLRFVKEHKNLNDSIVMWIGLYFQNILRNFCWFWTKNDENRPKSLVFLPRTNRDHFYHAFYVKRLESVHWSL